jgi:hypothetical protein
MGGVGNEGATANISLGEVGASCFLFRPPVVCESTESKELRRLVNPLVLPSSELRRFEPGSEESPGVLFPAICCCCAL